MAAMIDPRFPNLGKLSLAILEHLIEPVIGEKAIDEIRAPSAERELRELLAKALAQTEQRFAQEYSDGALRDAVLGLPVADLPNVGQAVRSFYDRPTDFVLAQVLHQQLKEDYPSLAVDRAESAVAAYMRILREELVTSLADMRSKLSALAALAIQSHTAQIAKDIRDIREGLPLGAPSAPPPGSAPPLPSLVIGREDALNDLKSRLGVGAAIRPQSHLQILTAIRGWPGVGKTTIASALAYDPDIAAAFPDGTLWVSLGTDPNILSGLAAWGRALGTEEILKAKTIEEASAKLSAMLRNKRMLLIIDDVWQSEHAVSFKVGGFGCAILITTRNNSIAQELAPTPNDIYRLAVLTDDKALDLLRALAPTVVARHSDQCLELVHELEGLPLALQVAGHMLNVEAQYGFGAGDLLETIREEANKYEGARILEAKAPADRVDLSTQTTPTIAALFQKSTDRLDQLSRDCFAYLGAFAPKPATFDLTAMQDVWQVEDAKPIARTLVDRGLLEIIPTIGRYQMHALLVMHAKSLLTEE